MLAICSYQCLMGVSMSVNDSKCMGMNSTAKWIFSKNDSK